MFRTILNHTEYIDNEINTKPSEVDPHDIPLTIEEKMHNYLNGIYTPTVLGDLKYDDEDKDVYNLDFEDPSLVDRVDFDVTDLASISSSFGVLPDGIKQETEKDRVPDESVSDDTVKEDSVPLKDGNNL